MTLTLCSCASEPIKFWHNPVGCLGQPPIPSSTNLTQEEYDKTPGTVLSKVKEKIIILRQRIDSQCEINKEHDKLHQEEEK